MRVLARTLRRRVRGGRLVTGARGKVDPRELASVLALSPSESTPLGLELAQRQAQSHRPRDVLAQHERDGYVAPFMLDQRTVHRLDGLALEAAAEFEAVQLSPVAPLGSWAAHLTSNRRMRFVASGLGLQRALLGFKRS
jgi:hypothetical protein